MNIGQIKQNDAGIFMGRISTLAVAMTIALKPVQSSNPRAPRYEIPFFTISSEKFEKFEQELLGELAEDGAQGEAGHPGQGRAVQRAAEAGTSYGAPTEREALLAEEVVARVDSVEKVRMVSSGTEAAMTAVRLARAGIPFTVVEKNPDVGGTWFENRYPGCRVDVGNHFYCYSFAPNDDWTEFFARQPELQRYFGDCADAFGIR